MNNSGFIRGIMSKNFDQEKFLLHVGETIEKQLQEWDENYRVNILKMNNYIFIVKNKEKDFWLEISEQELEKLQHKSPYSLDYQIWTMLAIQGIDIKFGNGDYLEKVFGIYGRR